MNFFRGLSLQPTMTTYSWTELIRAETIQGAVSGLIYWHITPSIHQESPVP